MPDNRVWEVEGATRDLVVRKDVAESQGNVVSPVKTNQKTNKMRFYSFFSFGNQKLAVETENITSEFRTFGFRNFEFFIYNFNNSRVLQSKT